MGILPLILMSYLSILDSKIMYNFWNEVCLNSSAIVICIRRMPEGPNPFDVPIIRNLL